MNREYEFINECGTFYVLTMNGDFPAGRPFGAIMELNNDLYISTADTKAVYRQLKQNERMQIIALRPGTREWIRVNGIAEECMDLAVKKRMLAECPGLKKHYSSEDAPHYSVFRIKIVSSMFY